MAIVQILSRDPVFLLARFWTIRKAYSWLAGLTNSKPVTTLLTASLFPDLEVTEAVAAIRAEAVFLGLKLPGDLVDEIREFARAAPLHPVGDRYGLTFRYADVERGRCNDGRRMPIGGVPNPEACSAVRRIVDDPSVRSIVREYLGYEPRKRLTLLDWSFASDLTEEECRKLNYGVIDYHYDVHDYNFVYVNFYLTETDRNSGAHVMMKCSHKHKPLRMLKSTRAPEMDVWRQYGKENELMIEGPAGTGFIQDPSCFHRATRAKTTDRLMLAIRFS